MCSSLHMRVLFLLFIGFTWATVVPTCSWACNDPVCDAVCENKCAPVNCTITPMGSCPQVSGPSCSITCPPVNDTTVCPMCTVDCAALPVACTDGGSSITCDPANCGFECRPPGYCAYPTCQLQCNSPVCTAPAWGHVIGPSLVAILALTGFFAIM